MKGLGKTLELMASSDLTPSHDPVGKYLQLSWDLLEHFRKALQVLKDHQIQAYWHLRDQDLQRDDWTVVLNQDQLDGNFDTLVGIKGKSTSLVGRFIFMFAYTGLFKGFQHP